LFWNAVQIVGGWWWWWRDWNSLTAPIILCLNNANLSSIIRICLICLVRTIISRLEKLKKKRIRIFSDLDCLTHGRLLLMSQRWRHSRNNSLGQWKSQHSQLK
jgi:hypothetical protein